MNVLLLQCELVGGWEDNVDLEQGEGLHVHTALWTTP